MKMHLPKLIKKLIAFPKLFPRAAHPRQLVLCMLFMIFAGAGSRGGLLWADTWPPIPAADTNGQITVASKTITLDLEDADIIDISSLTLLVEGNVTIDLKGHNLSVGTLLVGGRSDGVATNLTVKDSTLSGASLTVGTYDVANYVETSLKIEAGAKVVVTGTIYLNTNNNGTTTITGAGTFDLSSARQDSQYSIPDIGAVIRENIVVYYEGSDYYWTGEADLNWTNKTNWTVDASDTTKHPAKYPGEQINSKVTFPSSISSDLVISNVKTGNTPKGLEITNSSDATVTLTLASGAEFNSVNIKSGKVNVNGAFTVSSLTNAGSLTASDITAGTVFSNSTIKTQNLTVSDIKFGTDTTKAGSLEITGNGTLTANPAYSFLNNLTIDSGATLSIANEISIYGNVIIENGAALSLSGDTMVQGNWTNNNASGGLTAGSSKITFAGSGKSVGGKQTFADVEFTGSGNTVSGKNTFGDVTISGATNFADDNTFGNINISSATSFDGNNTFTNFTSTTEGTSLTFGDGKNQTVNGKLKLSNTSLTGASTLITQGTETTYFEASSLTLDSNIKIKTASDASVVGGQFDISNRGCTTTSGNTNAAYATAFKNGWKLGSLTFTWTGSSSTDWNTATNWDIGIIPGGTYTSDASVIIPNTTNKAELSLSSDMTIKSLSVGSSTSQSNAKLTLSGSNDLTLTAASSPLTIYGIVNYSGSGRILNSTGSEINDLTHDGTVEYSGSAQTITDYGDTDYANLIVSGSASSSTDLKVSGNFTNSGTTSLTSTATFTGAVTNTGTLTLSDSTLTVAGNWTNTGTFNCGTSTVNFTGSNSTIAGNQTFYIANFSGNNATVSRNNNFESAVFTANTILQGSNSFTDFTCTTAGVTLTFGTGTTQTVSGNFTITGSSASKVSLTSSGSWTLDVATANANVSNASITNSHATNAYLSATNSTDAGGNVNWDFIGNSYTWTGTASSDWNTATNWSPASVPGPSTNANIPGGLTNYPDISSGTIKTADLTLSDSTSKVTLSGTNDLTVTGTLTNKGSLVFSSNGRIKNGSGNEINDPANNGTVEYSGSAQTITEYGDTDYANLIVSGSASSSTDLKVSGTFKNSGTTSLANTATFTGAVTNTGTITNTASTTFLGSYTGTSGSLIGSTSSDPDPTIEFKGDVTLGIFTANGDTVKLSGSATQSLTTNNQTFYNIVFENSSASGVSVNGNLTSDGTITNNTKIALANSGTMSFAAYSGSGSISTNGAGITSNAGTATTISSLTASGDCTITNNGSAALSLANLTATSGKTLTLASAGDTAPLTVGNASWNSCNLTITGSGTVALSSSTSTNPLASLSVQSGSLNLPSETYATALTNAAGATVTATGPSPLTVAGPLTNAGSLSIASSSTSPITVNGSLNNSGSLTISDTSANPGSVTITGTITNAGSLTLANTTLTAAASWTTTSTGTFTCGTSTVNFTGAGATIAGDQTFYIANFSGQNASVTDDNTYTRASFSGTGITISGSNTFAQANFSGNNITLSGDNTFSQATFSGAGITLSGTNTFEAASFTGEGTTLTASNTFKTATFTANTTLSADNTFTTFNCTTAGVTLTFGDGKRQRIESDGSTQCSFTIAGSADEPVILCSQTRGTEQSTWWILDMEIPSNASVQYASISSSYAESDISAMVSNSTEEIEGTTDGWFNAGNIFYWAGNLSSDWSDRLNWSLKRNNLAGRPPALPPSLTDGSSTIIHLAPSTAYNLDYSQVPGQIKLNNLIIETDTLIQKDLTANYILLFGGRTELQAALSATEDLIMLGQNYSSTDQQTGLSNIYTYPGSSTITSLADQNADYTARLFCTAGASLTAKNFYANGITASSSGDWTLKIHSNFNTNQTFAQAFYCDFSDSACKVQSSDAPEDADSLKIMAEECNLKEGYTTGWDYEDFIIQQASTCDDNVIKVDFNRAIRNDASTVTNASAEIILTDAQNACSGIFTDQACTSSLPASDSASSFYSTVYLKSPATWNTDASSLSAGSGTDKSGVNRTISPIIKVDRNNAAKASFITDLYGKRLRHYNAESGEYLPFTNVQDACGPVLLYVLTGQELHSEYDSSLGEASQPYYDAHNFLEFRYSEALSIESWPAGLTENIPVSDSLGAVQGSMENSGELPLTLAGLCQIQKGQLYTGRQGQANKYVNAFYYPDSTNTSIFRLSIAGLTDGTIADRSASQHKNWVGYIEAAVQPSGSVTLTDSIDTSAIKDLAGNNQVSAKISVNVDSTENGIYGSWDLTEPSFTPLMLNISDNWEAGEYYEALGNSISGELYIDEIEFHLFDNMPKYTSEESAVWHTERGWIQRGTNDQLYTDFSYAADIIGGARPFDTDQTRRTSGGIRYSPLAAAAKAFKFTPSQTASAIPDTAFPDLLPYHGAKGTLFTGSSETRRAADRHDGLYFGLELPGKSFSFTDSFTLSYDDTIGFITDLAGNRLRSATIKTIDRTPPAYNLTIGPVNQKELLLLLSKHVVSDIEKIRYIDQSGTKVEISESFESLLPYCFEIINIDSSGNASAHASLQPDTSIPAKVSHITSESDGTEITQIVLTMTNDITYKDLCDSYIRLVYPEKYGEFSVDPVTGIQNARVTFIQDQLGNFMNMYDAHALSELAVNVISPSYGCTSDSQPAVGWSVHDWNADQQNFGTLPAGHDYDIVASCVDGLEHAILCFSAKPDSSSISTKINSDLNLDYRIWLPILNGFSFPAFTYTPSSTGSYQTVNASASEGQLIHTIPAQMTADFSSGSQVSFLYAMADSNYNPLTICNIPTYDITTGLYNTASANRIPLFAVRQLDLSNLLNLDLWSFKIKGLTLQRGGVTIFNNVINVSNGESLTLQVDVAEEGVLNIMIMTLDGNVIDYLAHGKTAAGSYTYTWNGRNKAGNPVARGMYFIRVMGKNFDETRKVMVVK